MQVDCQDFLSTSLMQVVPTTASLQISSCSKPDFHRLEEANRLDATIVDTRRWLGKPADFKEEKQ